MPFLIVGATRPGPDASSEAVDTEGEETAHGNLPAAKLLCFPKSGDPCRASFRHQHHARMKTILTSLFAVLLSLSLLTSCSSKKTLVGKWQGKGGQIEFTKDKKMLITMGGVTVNGSYSVVDDTHFKMIVDMGGGNKQDKTFGYTVNGDTLTTDDSGVKEEMKRVN